MFIELFLVFQSVTSAFLIFLDGAIRPSSGRFEKLFTLVNFCLLNFSMLRQFFKPPKSPCRIWELTDWIWKFDFPNSNWWMFWFAPNFLPRKHVNFNFSHFRATWTFFGENCYLNSSNSKFGEPDPLKDFITPLWAELGLLPLEAREPNLCAL